MLSRDRILMRKFEAEVIAAEMQRLLDEMDGEENGQDGGATDADGDEPAPPAERPARRPRKPRAASATRGPRANAPAVAAALFRAAGPLATADLQRASGLTQAKLMGVLLAFGPKSSEPYFEKTDMGNWRLTAAGTREFSKSEE